MSLCPWWYRLALALLALAILAPQPAWAAKRALLVGVGDYTDPRVSDLQGPPHDVAVLRDALVRHGGFADADITVLLDGEATRNGILEAIDRLGHASQGGDFVLIYLSGHGTSAFNPGLILPLPHHSGAFVPADFAASGDQAAQLASLVIGARDLRPRLQAMDDRQVSGLILIDSCYAQYTSRALHAPAKTTVYRTLAAGLEDTTFDAPSEKAQPYPYRHLATLTASSKKEVAVDETNPHRTLDGRPHGAFTDSLLRTLRQMHRADANRDGAVSHAELFAAIRARMSAAGYAQSPQILPLRDGDPGELQGQPAFASPPPVTDNRAEPVSPLSVEVQGPLPLVLATVRQTDGLRLARDPYDLRVARSDDTIRLLTAVGDLVFASRGEAPMAQALRQQAWVGRLLRTPNTGQRFGIHVRMDGYCGETFEAGDVLGFAARMDAAAYLLLVDAAPDGAMRVLYPYHRRELAAVPAGQPVRIGSIHVTPPFGIDHVIAAGFVNRPALYDARLLNGAAFEPETAGHRELRALLQSDGNPNLARQVVRVVTVPNQAPGFQGCGG